MQSYDWLLALVPALIVIAIWRSSEAKRRQRINEIMARYRDHRATYQSDTDGPSRDFAALIHAITAQGRANRKEERREDRGKCFRDWLTIGLIAATLGAVSLQVREMIKVYEPIRIQAEAAADSERAWIGPADAKMEGVLAADGLTRERPATGKPIFVTVSYRNSGHSPAMAVRHLDTISREYTAAQWNDGRAVQDIADLQKRCVDSDEKKTGGIVFPSDTPTTFLESDFSGDDTRPPVLMTDDILQGRIIITFLFCSFYLAGNQPRHTAFGYFYRAKYITFDHLGIVQVGNDAN